MDENRYELWYDNFGDGKIVERIAADLDLETACLLIKAVMEKYFADTQFSLILKHAEAHNE